MLKCLRSLKKEDHTNQKDRLSEDKIDRAIRLNERFSRKTPIRYATAVRYLDLDPDESPESDIAVVVHKFQVKNDLVEDGVLGPKTQSSVLGEEWKKPSGDNFFLFDGTALECSSDLEIITPDHPEGLDLRAESDKGWSERSPVPVNLFVSHWDGMYTSHGCFNVLVDRGTGMHFAIDWDGTVYQFLDLKWKAWGQGRVNSRSIGVEIANPVKPERNDKFGTGKRDLVPIEVYSSGNPGAKVLGFNKAQIRAHNLLVEEMCRLFKIPKQLPAWDPEVDKGEMPKDGVSRGVMPGGQRSNDRIRRGEFAGVCGHYHVTYRKQDPGVQLWKPLRDRGFRVG